MPNLLFELGCEEMPASAAAQAGTHLAMALERSLRDAGLAHGPIRSNETPRRLIIGIDEIDARQPDQTSESRGPRIESAFDEFGHPTRALEGFCRGQSCNPTELTQRDGYVWAIKNIPGRSAVDILGEILPAAVRGLRFDKSMRWGSQKERFVRPIRWILALLDGEVLDLEILGIRAGRESRGHRFMAPDPFAARASYREFLNQLRERFVEPDSAERRNRILEAISELNEDVILDERLIEENNYLVEWPQVHVGQFSEEYMSLPDPVLITAMVKHQRFLPVKSKGGDLTNRFVAIRNNGDSATVRAGNEWVLNARFNDARFFYREDQKKSLDEFLEMTRSMAFQPGLGSIRDRADRLAKLTPFVFQQLGGTEADAARLAGLYAKADLPTGLVNELNSLQGQVGGIYVRRQGLGDEIATAIEGHYQTPDRVTPENLMTVSLTIADQMDKLVGFLGIGLIPKGSSDPYGLRRAAGIVVQIGLLLQSDGLDLGAIAERATQSFAEQGVEIKELEPRLVDVFVPRYESVLSGYGNDVHQAVQADSSWPRLARPYQYNLRCGVVSELKASEELIQTLTRPLNIFAAATAKNEPVAPTVDGSKFANESGLRLMEAIQNPQFDLATAIGLKEHLEWLQGPINTFFEETMVMDQNAAIRANNLALIQMVNSRLLEAGDFSKIVFDES